MPTDYVLAPKRVPPFLPAPYLQALGNIAAYWVYLESATEVTIWALLNLNYVTGSAVTTHMGLVTRLHLLTILADHLLIDEPKIHTRFLGILAAIDSARTKRNDCIHGMWKHTKEKSAPTISNLKRSAKGKLKIASHPTTLAELRSLACEILGLTTGLQAFVEVMFPDFDVPWPRTP